MYKWEMSFLRVDEGRTKKEINEEGEEGWRREYKYKGTDRHQDIRRSGSSQRRRKNEGRGTSRLRHINRPRIRLRIYVCMFV